MNRPELTKKYGLSEPNLGKLITESSTMLSKQRSEILDAFVAKYGCFPEEVQQIVTTDGRTVKWHVELKQKSKTMTTEDKGFPCRSKENHNHRGTYYGGYNIDGGRWAVVKWAGEDEPELVSAYSIEVSDSTYKPIV